MYSSSGDCCWKFCPVGRKKEQKIEEKEQKIKKKFQTSSSLWKSSCSSSSTADEDEKRSSRASKSKVKKNLVMFDNTDDDNDEDCESSEFEEDVPQTLDALQPITYTTKPDKGSFLTQVILKWELHSSFEHGYVIADYQLKTFKTNLFQKGRRMLTNCVQYFCKRPLKFVMVGTFYGLCIANRENFVHESHVNVMSHLE